MLSDAPGSDKEQWESVISPSGRGYYHQNVRRSMQECRTSKYTHKHTHTHFCLYQSWGIFIDFYCLYTAKYIFLTILLHTFFSIFIYLY